MFWLFVLGIIALITFPIWIALLVLWVADLED